MMIVPTYLAISKIHGLGVFSSEPITKGGIIWRPVPEVDVLLPMEKFKTLPEFLQREIDLYGFITPGRPDCYYLEFGNGRFMNHSDTPNTDFSKIDEYGTALRDIAKGEEITCNYSEFCLVGCGDGWS
jgi:uncharacterized protein